MSLEITPEPDDAERRAILAAPADEGAEQRMAARWAAVPPTRDSDPEEP